MRARGGGVNNSVERISFRMGGFIIYNFHLFISFIGSVSSL